MLRVLAAALCVRARQDHALLRRPVCDPCSARCGQHAWNQLGSSRRLTFLAIPKSSTRHTHGLLRRAAGTAFAYVHVRPRARVDGGPADDRPCAAAACAAAGANATLLAAWARLYRPPALVVAVVREPVARLLSEYSFNGTTRALLEAAPRPLGPTHALVRAAARHAALPSRRDWQTAFLSGRTRVIQSRFKVSVPRARVSKTAPTLRERSER